MSTYFITPGTSAAFRRTNTSGTVNRCCWKANLEYPNGLQTTSKRKS
jgi:hypothetical protein